MGTPQAGTGEFTHCPHSLQMMGKHFPAAARLCSGKAWQVKLGEGCHNPMACDLLQAPSSSFSQSIPAPSLHAPRRGLSLPRVTPLPPACSLQHFCRAEGVQSCRGFRLFVQGSGKAASRTGCCLLFHLAPPSLEDSLLPSLCWGQPRPVVLHMLPEGRPGKGNGKKALRGSRRGAERDSSPFSFTLSFL